jgi:hypothetical protein
MAQVVERLISKHKALCSNPNTAEKEKGKLRSILLTSIYAKMQYKISHKECNATLRLYNKEG